MLRRPALFLATVAASLALCNVQDEPEVAYGLGLAFAGGEGEAPEWVQLFPKGPTIEARDGRKWTLRDPQVVVAAFKANGADLPFDTDHAVELKGPKGEDAPARGWITDVEVRDGEVWGKVDWTSAGARLVQSKAYRYVSPAFRHTKAGEIIALSSAALVTRPALRMAALAHQQQETNEMTLAQRLAALLGLAAAATDDDIVAKATEQVALAAETRDPAKFVPAADLSAALTRATDAETELATLKASDATKVATAAVDDAIAAGKIAPASKDHWLAIASATPDAFTKAVEAMPALTAETRTRKSPDAAAGGAEGLDADQLAICSQLGLEPADFAKTLETA